MRERLASAAGTPSALRQGPSPSLHPQTFVQVPQEEQLVPISLWPRHPQPQGLGAFSGPGISLLALPLASCVSLDTSPLPGSLTKKGTYCDQPRGVVLKVR